MHLLCIKNPRDFSTILIIVSICTFASCLSPSWQYILWGKWNLNIGFSLNFFLLLFSNLYFMHVTIVHLMLLLIMVTSCQILSKFFIEIFIFGHARCIISFHIKLFFSIHVWPFLDLDISPYICFRNWVPQTFYQ